MPTWAKNNWQATANSKPTPQDLDDIGNSMRLIGLPLQAAGTIQVNYNSQDIVNLRQLVFLAGTGSFLDLDHGVLEAGVIDLHNYIKIKHDASPNQYLVGPFYDANNLDFVHSTTGFASHNHLMSLTPAGNLGLGIGGPSYRIQALLGNLPNAVGSVLNALNFHAYTPNTDWMELVSYRHTDGATAGWGGAEWRLRRVVDAATEICGIYFDAWKLKFRANSLETMTIDQDGVGFKNPNPSSTVDIAGGDQQPAISSANGVGAFSLRKAAGVNNLSLMMGNYDNYSWIQSVEPGVVHRNLILQPIAANVGIGTTTPAGLLDVAGSFYTEPGGLVIRPQSVPATEGGQITLLDHVGNSWIIDIISSTFRIFKAPSTVAFHADGINTSVMIGGALRTLSVDGSGFVKAT